MINFHCPKCRQKIRANDDYAGKQIKCPKCGQPIRIFTTVDQTSKDQANIIKFRCPGCNQKIGIDKTYAGRTVRCAMCKQSIQVPVPVLRPLTELPAERSSPHRPDLEILLAPRPVVSSPAYEASAGDMRGGETPKNELHSAEVKSPVAEEPRTTISGDEEVLDEINKLDNRKKNGLKNLVIFAISLFIFFQIGLIKNSIADVLILVFVLLVHEMGHFTGMRLFGYRNVGMFFVPFFGAAVSGEGRNVASYKKAIVTLLGPVPGLATGVVLLATCGKNEYCRQMAIMFLSINLFNLLPIFPLDGGRLLHQVLFCRNRYVEMVFTILAAVLLVGAGVLGKVWILGLLGLFLITSIGPSFKVAQVCKECQGLFAETTGDEGESIPAEAALQIIRKLRERINGKVSAKTIAGLARQVWEKVQTRPPGAFATVGLLGVYISSILVTLAILAVIVVFSFAKNSTESKIVDYQKESGESAKKEQLYVLGKLTTETELNVDGSLYNGKAVSYHSNGNILRECQWYEGKWDGEWKAYDSNGKLISVTVFDKGKFVVCREVEGDRWIEITEDKLPLLLRKAYNMHATSPPKGPKQQIKNDEKETNQ